MHDITTLLRNADPGAETAPYTEDQRAVILARAVAPVTPPRRRLGIRIGAVAAATLVVIGIGTSNLATPSISARAAEVLSEAAINAKDPVAKPGQYWEIASDYVGGSSDCPETYLDRRYVSVDGTKPTLDWSENTSPACRGELSEEPRISASIWSRSPNELADNWSWPSPKFLASLPRDVDQLRDRMYADSAGLAASDDLGVFVLASEALESGAAPSDLRAALFGVLKSVPGLAVVEETTIDGRPVVIFAVSGAAYEQLMIDPSTGEMVGFRAEVSPDNVRTVVYERRAVDEIPPEMLEVARVRDCTIDPSLREEFGTDGQLVCDS